MVARELVREIARLPTHVAIVRRFRVHAAKVVPDYLCNADDTRFNQLAINRRTIALEKATGQSSPTTISLRDATPTKSPGL